MKKFTVILLVIAMLMSLAACSGSSSNEVQEELPPEESVSFTVAEIRKMAEDTSGQWEMLQKMLPDYVVYKNMLGSYAYHPVNKELPLDTYDWSNLRAAHKGIDVSRYQKDIDWDKVAETDVEFAIIQCGYRGYTEGKLVVDSCYEQNMRGAIRADIPVGVYFVTQAANKAEALEEADFVIDLIKPYKIDYPVVIDVEEVGGSNSRVFGLTADMRTEIIKTFCERVKEAGYTPMIYSGLRWYIEEMDLEQLADYDKWFAIYGFNYPYFRYQFQIWQNSDQGKVNGITGNVDIDYCYYDYLGEEE